MNFETLIETSKGSIQTTACCVRIRFDNLVWKLSRKGFDIFYDYIQFLSTEEGFAANAYSSDTVMIAMEKHVMMATMSRTHLYEFKELLEQAKLELFRRSLIQQYQAEDEWLFSNLESEA